VEDIQGKESPIDDLKDDQAVDLTYGQCFRLVIAKFMTFKFYYFGNILTICAGKRGKKLSREPKYLEK